MTNYNQYANVAQESLDFYYKSNDEKQFMNNVYPLTDEKENEVFNYWWLAHLVDIRIDAYLRTKDEKYLEMAKETYQYNKSRNKGTLLHEYYDDMLWNALAALRLYKITDETVYFEDAKEVCLDIFNTAWNETMGGGFAWKRTQMTYKNTPVNAPIILLAMRLYKIEPQEIYIETSKKTLEWLQKTLIQPDTQFAEDGINRNNDGEIDTQWRFTYNQGVYIGALLEFYSVTKDKTYLSKALTCAKTAIDTLTKEGVFDDQGDGGDIGLFKGILYRYLHLLYKETNEQFIKSFIENSCDILIENASNSGKILAYRDWLTKDLPKSIYLSDELSGVMALESAAGLD
ncbi:hypothetical protein IGI37_000799 [Enterococcus sp. AZ194]|uniref:glycoside hydrolase family 76 protein n=1 Tax=Enterococcus sp. AZ194 TaxID=2774629 RepID=UPI003F20A8E1